MRCLVTKAINPHLFKIVVFGKCKQLFSSNMIIFKDLGDVVE